MSLRKFVNVNILIGALTAIANGGAAMMMLGSQSRYTVFNVAEAVVLASVGASLAVSGGLAVAGRASMQRVLAWQASALACLLLVLTLWGITVLLTSPDRQVRISWMVGILSALAIYVFHLLRLSIDVRKFESLRSPLMIAGAVAIAVDLGMFMRVGWF